MSHYSYFSSLGYPYLDWFLRSIESTEVFMASVTRHEYIYNEPFS